MCHISLGQGVNQGHLPTEYVVWMLAVDESNQQHFPFRRTFGSITYLGHGIKRIYNYLQQKYSSSLLNHQHNRFISQNQGNAHPH